jgi:hypothetical protein
LVSEILADDVSLITEVNLENVSFNRTII